MKIWLPTIRAGSGADVFTERLAAGLARVGCEPSITWIAHGYELWPGLSRHRPPAGTQVIHANSWSAYAFVRHELPTVATEHGFVGDPGFERIKTRRQRAYHDLLIGRYVFRSFQQCAAVTAVSQHLAYVIQPYCVLPVVAIPNWIDTQLFQPSARVRQAQQPFRVLYAGTNSIRKGFDIVKRLVQRPMSGVELWCRGSLRSDMAVCRMDVRFFDKIPAARMPELYAQCDAVLMPSRYEGFGYVAAEAMACGRSVIGFDCGALREVCGTEGAAILVRMDDMTAIEDAINALAADRGKGTKMGEAGRQRVLERFNEAKAIDAYVSMYQSLLA